MQFASTPSNAEERYRETAPGGPHYDITLDEIRKHLQRNTAAFIDARLPEHFAHGHIRGAFNVPASLKESYMRQIWENVPRDRLIIIYCAGPWCGAGDMVYDYLASQGFVNLRVYNPGWEQVKNAKDLLQ